MEIACDSALQNRRYDAEGRLHILRTPISKATVNPYAGREIPEASQLGLDPERIYYMLRDPGELAKAAQTFARNQLMFKHIAVSADDPKQDNIAGTVGSDVEFVAPYLIADLCIWDVEAIAGVETDTVRELSSSYRYRADMTPGMYEGQRYDGVMRDIQGNHVALVKAGRAGSDVKAADSELEIKMTETKFGKALYAILCAASPKLAADSALKPLVIGLTRKQCDLRALEPKLLAMDAELRKEAAFAAMDAAKDAESEEETEEEKKAKEAEKAKDKKAKDKKAMDADHPEGCMCGDCKTARDAEPEEEKEKREKKAAADKKAKDAEEKKAEDKMTHAMDEFKAELRQTEEIRRMVRPVVGEILAHDSGEGMLDFALDHMKVDRSGVTGINNKIALFKLAQQASKPAPRMAFDSSINIGEKFKGADRPIRVM